MESDIPIILTNRLRLRPFTSEDVAPLHLVLSNHEVMRYFPNPEPPQYDKVKRLIDAQLRHWYDHGYGWWAIEPIDRSLLIGWGGLQYLPDTNETEVAYLLSKDWWGKGLATEIAVASLDYGFRRFAIDRIVGIVHLQNLASQRVLEKAGLLFTGNAKYFGMECRRYELHFCDYSIR